MFETKSFYFILEETTLDEESSSTEIRSMFDSLSILNEKEIEE